MSRARMDLPRAGEARNVTRGLLLCGLLACLLAAAWAEGGPTLVRTVPLPMGIPRQAALSPDGRTLLLAHDEGWNVVALDVSQPTRPRLAGVGATGGFCRAVASWQGKVVAADARAGLRLFDFRGGADPFRALPPAGSLPVQKPTALATAGDTLFVAGPGGVTAWPSGRTIPGLEPPLAAWLSSGKPVVAGASGSRWRVVEALTGRELATLAGGVTSAGSGGKFLLVARGREVEVLDLGSLRPLGALQSPKPVLAVRVRGSRALLCGETLAVADLEARRLRATVAAEPNAGTYATRIPAFLDGLWLSQGFVAVVDRFWGIRILREDTLEQVADFPTSGGDSTGLQVDGERLYAGNNWGGVTVLDLSDPDRPRPVASTRRMLRPNPGSAGFLARGGRLWLQGNEDRVLRALDLGTGRVLAQRPVGRPAPAGDTRRFGAGYPAFADGLLYLPGFARVLRAETLELLGEDQGAGFEHDSAGLVTLRGRRHAVLTGEQGLVLVDVHDPAAPRRAAVLPGDFGAYYFARGLQVRGTLAYVANRKELRVVDLVGPRLLASLQLPGEPVDVQVSGGVAYVAAYYGGLHLVDVRDPSKPRLVQTFRKPTAPELGANTPCYQAVEVARGRIYVAEYYSGLQVLRP